MSEHPIIRQRDYSSQASFALHQRLQTGQQDSCLWQLPTMTLGFSAWFLTRQWNLKAASKTLKDLTEEERKREKNFS